MTFYNLYSIFFVMLVYFCPWICVTLDASHRHPPEALVSRVIDLVVAWDTEGRWVSRDRYSNRGFPQCFVWWEAWLHLATHACRNWLGHFLWGYGLKVLVRVWFLCHCSIVTLNFCLQRGRGAHSLVLLRWTGLLRLCPYNYQFFIIYLRLVPPAIINCWSYPNPTIDWVLGDGGRFGLAVLGLLSTGSSKPDEVGIEL